MGPMTGAGEGEGGFNAGFIAGAEEAGVWQQLCYFWS